MPADINCINLPCRNSKDDNDVFTSLGKENITVPNLGFPIVQKLCR